MASKQVNTSYVAHSKSQYFFVYVEIGAITKTYLVCLK